MHLDGARLWNAAVKQGVRTARDRAGLRLGVGVPVEGPRRAGRLAAVRRPRFHQGGAPLAQDAGRRHAPGGHPRRRGQLCARPHIARLAEDHANAARLAAGLARHRELDVAPAQTNMVFVGVPTALAARVRRAPRRRRHHDHRHDPPALGHAPRRRRRRRRARDGQRRPVLRRTPAPPGCIDVYPYGVYRSRHGIRDRHGTARCRGSASEQRVELGLEGMTCAACATRIEKVLNRVPGVGANVNFATETATARFDAAAVEAGSARRRGRARRLPRASSAAIPEKERAADQARKAAAYAALQRELIVAVVLTLPLARPDGADARARRMVRRRGARRDPAALAAIGAGDAGAVLDRPPLLRRRLQRAARRRRQHGRAGRAGHDHGLGVQRRGHAARAARASTSTSRPAPR